MPVPPLNEHGLLPAGAHVCTPDEMKASFVDAFETSSTRHALFGGWLNLRNALRRFVPVTEIWVDGSFVTDKPDPGDIDVLIVFDGVAFDCLEPELVALAGALMSNKYTREYWGCDSYPLPVYPDDHPFAPAVQRQATYWHDTWSMVRDHDELTKGYLVIR